MSSTVVKKYPLGVGQLYWNNTRIGSNKSESKLIREEDIASYKPGDEAGATKVRLIEERAFVEVNISDFTIEQYRLFLGIANAVDSTGTLDSATTSITRRVIEEIYLSGTAAVSLANANVSNVVVESLDRLTTYTVTSDYTVQATAGTITPVSGGDISSIWVKATYQYTDAAAAVMQVGGKKGKYQAELRFEVETPEGQITFLGHIAVREGNLEMPFNETEFSTTPIRFKLLHDITKPKGAQLFYFG